MGSKTGLQPGLKPRSQFTNHVHGAPIFAHSLESAVEAATTARRNASVPVTDTASALGTAASKDTALSLAVGKALSVENLASSL